MTADSVSYECSGEFDSRIRVKASWRTTAAIALVVAVVAVVGGFYFARGHTTSMPNDWVTRTRTDAYLLQWTRAGSQFTGSLEDGFSICGSSLSTSTYNVNGVVADGSVTLRIDEGGGIIDTVVGSASPTRLTFAEMRFHPGGEASFNRLARMTPTNDGLGQPCSGG